MAVSGVVVAFLVSAFSVGGPVAAAESPRSVLTAISASTNGSVVLGATVTESLTVTSPYGLSLEGITFLDAGGKEHRASETSTPGSIPVTIDKTWAPGPVQVSSLALQDSMHRDGTIPVAYYYADGRYYSFPAGWSTHSVDFAPALFTVVNPQANVTPPIASRLVASTTALLGPGQTVTERVDVQDADETTGTVNVRSPDGRSYTLTIGKPFVIPGDWPDGTAHVTSIRLSDAAGNTSSYGADGSLTTLPATGNGMQNLRFAGGDFVVAAKKLSASTIPIVTGAATVGAVLTAHTGVWDPAPVTFTYEWRVDGFAYNGGDKARFTVPPTAWGRRITVVVTGSKPGYRPVPRTSAATHSIVKPLNGAPTPVIVGPAKVGGTLVAHRGSWIPGPVTLHDQWLANGVAIPNATGLAFRPTVAQLGKKITVRITGTRTGYATTVRTSTATKAVTR